MNTLIPKNAETLDLMTYVRHRRSPSKFVKGAEQIETMLACPRCQHERPLSVSKFNCAGCGLAMQPGVTTLEIWIEEPAKEPA